MNRADMIALLERDEGLRLKPYKDTVGKLTIGIGRNLDDVGITAEEARYLVENDIGRCEADLNRNLPGWRDLTEARQQVMVSLVFNLGWPNLSGFLKFLAALKRHAYAEAADELRDSLWYRQVKGRGERLAKMMEEG
ncbi:MAG: lysozyme [Caulobacteraceae bacterium]|nr:lysozyme [Caulobacteraceae bacterium]